eukprot:Nitzschia sp. Nitz4//scaffold56_size114212//50021//51254//NITZ4_003947-RA/size114212-processed-gene-0.63-mRNA-1//-1//CDS//3329554697//919//frame0
MDYHLFPPTTSLFTYFIDNHRYAFYHLQRQVAYTAGATKSIGTRLQSTFRSTLVPSLRTSSRSAPPPPPPPPPGAAPNSPRRRSIPLWVRLGFAVPTVGLTYLYFHYLEPVPLTKRQRWIATTPEWEKMTGDQTYQQLLQEFKGKVLPQDHPATVTVKRVGHRIHVAAKSFCQENELDQSHRCVSAPPTFTVVRSDMANAFVLPNNHVFVMTGLFQFAQNEDDLASVLGHEMAHNLARHMGERVSGNIVVQLLARMSLLLDPTGTVAMLFLPTATVLRELPHSRTQELEADHIGMHLAAKACYDPAAAQRVFTRMQAAHANANRPPHFLSTHPTHEARLVKMKDWLPETQSILQREGGETCRAVREDMAAARRLAARRFHLHTHGRDE